MANKQLTYDLVLETNRAVQDIKKMVSAGNKEAASAGKKGGASFGANFKTALTAVFSTISFQQLITQANLAINEYDRLRKANINLEGAIKATNKQLEGTGKALSLKEVNQAVDNLFNKFEGTVSKGTLIAGFSDFFRGGVTDVEAISNALQGYADIASAGKSEFVSLDSAIAQLTEQFRSERAALGETAGLTDEYISQILPRGLELLQSRGQLIGKNTEGLTKEERALAKLAGLEENFAIVQGNFNEQLSGGLLEQEKFSSAVVIFRQELGKVLKPVQIFVFEALTPMVEQITAFVQENPNLVLSIAGIATGFAGLLAIVSGVLVVLPALKAALAAIGAVLFFITSPIGVVVAAIGLLIGVLFQLYKNSEAFRNFVNEILEKSQEMATGMQKWFTQTILPELQSLWTNLKIIFDGIVQLFEFFWPHIQPFIEIFVDGFFRKIESVKNVFEGLLEFLSGFIEILAGVFSGNEQKISDGFAKMFSGVKKVAKEILNGVIGMVNDFIRSFNETANVAENVPGVNITDLPTIPRFNKGGDFMVPPGYPNDSFLMRVQSGERVIVKTPQQQSTDNRQMNSNNQTIVYSSTPEAFIPNFMPA